MSFPEHSDRLKAKHKNPPALLVLQEKVLGVQTLRRI